MSEHKPSVGKIALRSEEEFYDVVGELIIGRECLKVEEPERFLAGSMDAFGYMIGQMGSIQGKNILDYGCASGWLSVYFAKHGAQLEGFDVSGKLIEAASMRASANGVSYACNFRKMTAEELEYPDEWFDFVVGISILHHVELKPAIYHLQRVMKKGAVALFIEPLGENPVLNWARDRVFNIHHGLKKDKSTEHPLTYDNIHTIGSKFSDYHWREFQLISMVRRFLGDTFTGAMCLQKLDGWLLARLPALRRLCRLVVIEFHKI